MIIANDKDKFPAKDLSTIIPNDLCSLIQEYRKKQKWNVYEGADKGALRRQRSRNGTGSPLCELYFGGSYSR